MAYGSWPSSFTSSSYVAMGSRPLQIFSTMMVGAPIIWDTHTTASSGTSSGEMSSTSPYFLMASMAMSLPDVRVAAPAGAENRRAKRHVLRSL